MGQSLVQTYVHFVFSTKNREPFIDERLEQYLYELMPHISLELGWHCLIINGMSDHVHLLCRQNKNMSISEYMKKLKSNSSRLAKKKGEAYANFGWQDGYGAFSVGFRELDQIKGYIAKQKKHHANKNYFKEEFLRLVVEHGLEYDEQYIWL
jgi:putative transposase